jgi:hypothetical protein
MSRYSQRGTVCVGSRVRSKVKPRFVAIALICCAFSLSTWLSVQWRTRPNPQDFEQCSEKAETIASKDERASLIAQCDAQFVGRRRIGGGYTYYDFLQNRQFDIAGPNPTSKELKHFDEEYALYLSAQRKEANAVTIAEQQRQSAQSDFQNDRYSMGSISPPGPPMVITPTNVPLPRPAPSARAKNSGCEDASLSCSWTKFSAGVKNTFGSYAKANRP